MAENENMPMSMSSYPKYKTVLQGLARDNVSVTILDPKAKPSFVKDSSTHNTLTGN